MFEAVLAAILTLLILLGCAFIAHYIYRSRKGASTSVKSDVAQLDTIGVSPSGDSSGSDDIRVKSEEKGGAKKSDSMTRRFLALSIFTGTIFAALATRLWGMQLLSNKEYQAEATENLYTTVSTPAPRGAIYDTNGVLLVGNKVEQAVMADSGVIKDPSILRRLSTLLGLPLGVVRQRIKDESTGPQNRHVVESGVKLRDVAYISEHAEAFPGIVVESRTAREHVYGALGSHFLGYSGSPTKEELEDAPPERGLESTDSIGKSGIELYYDSVLSGEKGSRRVMVDATGNVIDVVSETSPQKGSDIYLTIDARVQYVADKALASTIAPIDGIRGSGKGVAGSIVAMDVTDGSVIAMASYPTYDPSHFANGIPQDLWDVYNSETAGAPMMNRSINGLYAAASTFKAFTSMAGLHYGFANQDSTWVCTGKWDGFGSGDVQRCWYKRGHGELDLHGGIVNSCDTVFYEIAKAFFDHGPEGTGEISDTALQEYLKLYNFGSPTEVDLPGESEGRIPTPQWKAEHWKNVPAEAIWVGGDYSNMIIGQGDVLVTPLQIAAAYGAIATGKLLKPHLIKEVRNSSGDVVMKREPEVLTEPEVNPEHLGYVRDSLHEMVAANRKIREAFERRGIDAAGKSGTAEHTDRNDDAWFVAYAPYEDPKYVVTCIIEQGGGGADTAAPVVIEVMNALMNKTGEETIGWVSGSSGRFTDVGRSSSSSRTD